MGIFTNIKATLSRSKIKEDEQLAREDLLHRNKDKIEDISQRRGMVRNSGLSIAERDYILSDSMIASAIQLYLADVLSICSQKSCIITSKTDILDDTGKTAKKLERVKNVFNRIYSDNLTEAIILNLLNNGEVFLDTIFKPGTNELVVTESPKSICTQLCFSDGSVACFVVSDSVSNASGYNSYNYNLFSNDNSSKIVDADKMVRIYLPTVINSKVLIDLDNDNTNDDINETYKNLLNNNQLYYTGSQSLLKQIYPDWLNSKLLELAVYRDRIAKSRFIQMIALELGRTSRETSDQIYDNVKEYFDNRAVIDLEQQTFKSVVGNEPFTDYKVYITRDGVGKISFDSSLNGADANVSSLADLEYNQTKVFAGLGIPKQYLGADDNGSALSNGGSLFFMDEKYQKRVISYVKKVALGYKESIKNLIMQQEESFNRSPNEFFIDWDFNLEFEIPENNEDIIRIKNSRIAYVNALLDLVDRLKKDDSYSIEAVKSVLQEDISKFMLDTTNGDVTEENEEDIDNNI